MILLWTDPVYLLFLVAWMIALALFLIGMLKQHRKRRKLKNQSASGSVVQGLLLSLWSLLALVTFLELVFVLFVNHSDAFNGTNVSKRWYARYMDAQRNDDGFRDRRTLDEPLPEGTKRYIVFGDSYVAGHGLKDMNQRFTERLEVQLNEAGEKVWVSNLGESGYEVSLIEALLKSVLQKKYPVDVMIYCYMLNDIEGYDPRTEEFLKKVGESAPTNPLITRTYFLNWMYYRIQQLKADAESNYFPHLKDSYNTRAWDSVVGSLDRMHALCQASGVEFRLVIFPFMQGLGPEYEFRDVHQKLVEWAKDRNVPYLDTEPLLSAHREEGLHVNPYDRHPNAHANQLIADAIFEWLQKQPPHSGLQQVEQPVGAD